MNNILQIRGDVYMADEKGDKKDKKDNKGKQSKNDKSDKLREDIPAVKTCDNADKAQEKKSIISFIESHSLLVTVFGGIIVAALCAIGTTVVMLLGLPAELENQRELAELYNSNITASIESQNKSIDDLKAAFNRETDYLRTEISLLNQNINDIYNRLLPSTNLRPTEAMIHAVTQNLADFDDTTGSNNSTGLVATTLVAYSIISREEFTVEQVADQRVLLPYMDGAKEVYFYGQLSATGAWDGKCIINIYENGKLTFIKEALYNNGSTLSSKQVFSYTFKPGVDVWAISNRISYEDHSEGETRIYKWEKDYMQTFEMDDVAAKDIVDVDTFQAGLNPTLYAYYHGNTSDGFFNDKTGNAYMVHFFDSGAVRLLYVGNFEDGYFNDTTGNAWYIVKDEGTDYMYCKGHFKDNKLVNRISSLPPPLSLEQIREIIGNRVFNVDLYWDTLGMT